MNSLRRFFINEVLEKQQSVDLEGPSAKYVVDEMEINNHWNTEIAKMRENRTLEMKNDRSKHILKSLERQKEFHILKKQDVNEKVQRIDEESKSFITRDLLDQAIEYALGNPTSYDYCIDSKGNSISKDSKCPEKYN